MTRFATTLSLIALVVFGHTAFSQAPPESEKPNGIIARVSIGKVSGPPGGSVRVPVTFNTPTAAKIRLLKLTVEFKDQNLKFDSLELGDLGNRSRVTTEFKAGDATSPAKIVISVVAQGERIPPAVLGYLKFEIDGNANGLYVPLYPAIEATEVGTDTPLPPESIGADSGWVNTDLIIVSPVCFFFTH